MTKVHGTNDGTSDDTPKRVGSVMPDTERNAALLPRSVDDKHAFSLRVPDGDTHARHVCDDCGYIHYVNPKIVVGSVVTWREPDGGVDDGEVRYLMCRRAIEPRKGFWTLPAGYLENGETTQDGARREALEEACADIRIDALLAVYSLAHISQVQLMYTATLLSPDIAVGEESLEVGLFRKEDIPWDELAFPSVRWALTQYQEVAQTPVFAPFTNPVETDSKPD
ncbi:MAG: NUDIX hydrolase [Candidatus Phaeomarinobacter sp.]